MNKSPDSSLRGVLAPVITPFRADLSIDEAAFVHHCRWLLSHDVGLAVFGTNSEGNSLSMSERQSLLEMLVAQGLEPTKMMPGTGCCALPDTVALTRHALDLGIHAVLMLPPFYYKNLQDQGLISYFSEVIERVGDERLRIYLYHFPGVSQVPIGLGVIEQLLKRYPKVIAGIKDSTGDWASTERYIDAFASQGFDVFPGTELLMAQAVRKGGAGCISATANVNPIAISQLYRETKEGTRSELGESVSQVRNIFQQYPLIAAMKRVVAESRNQPGWSRVRPPLLSMTDADYSKLSEALDQVSFRLRTAVNGAA